MDLDAFVARYRSVQTRSGEIAYVDVGSGPTVLFVHGVSVNSALWRRVVGSVADRFRCIAIDLPLHGRSPPRADHDYSLCRLAEMIRDVHDVLELPPIHLVGNDSGGAICQVFAASNPDRLRSLALTNCDTRGNIPPPAFSRTVELARQGRFAKSATRWTENLELARSNKNIGGGYRNPMHLTDEAIWHFLGPVTGTEKAARDFEHFLSKALREEDLVAAEPSLKTLSVPTAVIWAADDIFFGPQWAHYLCDLIPGADKPVFVDDAALYFADKRPESLTPHLLQHWGKSEAP